MGPLDLAGVVPLALSETIRRDTFDSVPVKEGGTRAPVLDVFTCPPSMQCLCNAYLGHLGRECQLCIQRRRHLWKQEHPGCGLAKEYEYTYVSHTVSQAQGRISVGPCVQTGLSQASGVAAYAKSLAEPCALVICLPPMKTFWGIKSCFTCCVQQAHLYSWIPIIKR